MPCKNFLKYYLIVLSLTFFAAVTYYVRLILPMHAILHEKSVVEQYYFRLARYQAAMNKINMTSFDLQAEVNSKEINLLNEAFREIPNTNYIRGISLEAKDGIDSITERKRFLDSINNDLFMNFEDIRNKSTVLFGSEDVSPTQIQSGYQEGSDEKALYLIKFKIMQLNRKMFAFNNLIDDTLNLIKAQVSIIDSRLNDIYFTINFLSALVVLGFLMNMGAVLLVLPSSLNKRIMDIRRNLLFYEYADGQVAVRLKIEDTSGARGIRGELSVIRNCLIIAFSGFGSRFLGNGRREGPLRTVFEEEEAAEMTPLCESIAVLERTSGDAFGEVAKASAALESLLAELDSVREETEQDLPRRKPALPALRDERSAQAGAGGGPLPRSDCDGSVLFRAAFSEYLRTVAGLGNIAKNIHSIRSVAASGRRLISGGKYGTILDKRKIVPLDHLRKTGLAKYGYPAERENELREALAAGDFERAQAAFDAYLAGLASCFPGSESMRRVCLFLLARTVNQALRRTEPSREPIQEREERYYSQIEALREDSGLSAWFSGELRVLAGELAENRKAGMAACFNKALRVIERNFMDDLSMTDVAGELGISPTRLRGVLEKAGGTSFTKELSRVRVAEAKRLLRGTDKSVTIIAYEVGFNDSNYFSTVFKAVTGTTPLRYRKAD